MDTATDPAPVSLPAPAPLTADDDPEPQREHDSEPIAEHHFQRPIVSPLDAGVRTVPRGG
jgi:hypothetical protein